MAEGWLYPWAIGSVAFGGASLVVPLYVVQLGGTAFTLGVLAAVAAFVGVPGALLVGRLADRTGRRRVYVLGSIGLVGATLVVLPFVGSIPVVILGNGLLWFAFAAAMPAVTLLAVAGADAGDWSARIGTLNKYQGTGWAGGLLVGAVWTGVGDQLVDPTTSVRSLFVLLGVTALLAVALGRATLPPEPSPARRISGFRLRSALRRSERFGVRAGTFPITVGRADFRGLEPRRFVERFTPMLAWYFVAVFLVFTGFAAFFAPLPAFLTAAGYTSDGIFGLYLVSSLASAAFFEAAGRWAGRGDPSLVQVYGLTVRGVAIPAVAVVGTVFGGTVVGFGLTTAVFGVIGITWALIAVTAGTLVTRLSPPAIRGESLGVYAALGAFAGGVGSLLGGWLAATSFGTAFAASGGLILAGAAVVLALRPRHADRFG